MKITNSELHVYYINPDDFKDRLSHIEDTIAKINPKTATRIAFNEKLEQRQDTMSKSHVTTVTKAMEVGNYPFLILEDDATFIKDNYIIDFEIPDQPCIIYLGASSYNCGGEKPNMFIKEYNDSLYRVYYSLSTHAMLIPDAISAMFYKKSHEKAIILHKFQDIQLASYSKDFLYLSPKDGPYFYQYGYNENVTKFLWDKK